MPAQLATTSPDNARLAAIDAANLGLDLIDHCVTPLVDVIAHLPCDNPDVLTTCELLQRQMADYRSLLCAISDPDLHA
jgi:hypothetical protein